MHTTTAFALGFFLVLAEPAQSQEMTVYRHGSTYSDVPGTGAPVVIRENTLPATRAVNVTVSVAPGPWLPAAPVPQPVPVVIQVTIRQAPVYHYTPPPQLFYRNRVR